MSLELLKEYIPGWAWAVILVVLTVASAIVSQLLAGGDVLNVVFAVIVALAPGIYGAKAIGGNTPPTDPTATAPVTP